MHKPKQGEAYVASLAVAKGARGMGAGTQMLQWSESVARARKSNFMSLGVVRGNPAQRLYERYGFVEKKEGCFDECCQNIAISCMLGCPHGRCGGLMMEKPLDAVDGATNIS